MNTVYFDGFSRGNHDPSVPSVAGGSFKFPGAAPVTFEFGDQTNNEAEFRSLLALLERMEKTIVWGTLPDTYIIAGDSQLVIEAMIGSRQVKAKNLKVLHGQCLLAVNRLRGRNISVIFKKVPREDVVAALGH